MRKVELEDLVKMKGGERLIIPQYDGPVYIVSIQSRFSPDRFDDIMCVEFKTFDSDVTLSFEFGVLEYEDNVAAWSIYYYDPYELPIYELGV